MDRITRLRRIVNTETWHGERFLQDFLAKDVDLGSFDYFAKYLRTRLVIDG